MNVSRNTRDKEFHDCRAQGNATEDGKRSKQAVVRRLVLALMLWSVLPAQAATPIRLQVIPYQVNKQALPALPALLFPSPMITSRPSQGNEGQYRAEVGTATMTLTG